MTLIDKARRFAELHVKGAPLVLYNAWDAGSAKAIHDAGAPAIATSSWAVAAAQGYGDGEVMPLQRVEQIVERIAATVDAPLTVDFEGGYSEDDAILSANVSRLLDIGVIGINIEDRVIAGGGLYDIDRQAGRIRAIRELANARGIPLFINARTDLFLGTPDAPSTLADAALQRAKAYAAAGASGFFMPGLRDEAVIESLCDACPLPVNIMMMQGVSPIARLSELGVARVSFGPSPYLQAMAALAASAAGSMRLDATSA